MKCPYCGAETTSHKCEYCDSDLSYLYTNNTTADNVFSDNIGQNIAENIPYGYQKTSNIQLQPDASKKSKNVALILCIIGFFGPSGIHRFYTGHILSGILWLCTGGLFSIGTIIDLIMILSDNFRDNKQLKLLPEVKQ